MDLEALAVARAEQQIESGAWRTETRDTWLLRGTPRCESCGRPIYSKEKVNDPVCPGCRRATKRQRCWACGERAEIRGYCRNHWDQVSGVGVVDSLHISAREGRGAPAGFGRMRFGKGTP